MDRKDEVGIRKHHTEENNTDDDEDNNPSNYYANDVKLLDLPIENILDDKDENSTVV